MPLREDLLNPIAGENPSGVDLRYDNRLLLFDKIKEARRRMMISRKATGSMSEKLPITNWSSSLPKKLSPLAAKISNLPPG